MAKEYDSKFRNVGGMIPFTQIPTYIATDLRINGNAVRMIFYLMSRPPGWIPRRTDIMNQIGLGRSAFDTAVKKMVEAGYLNKETYKNKKTGYNQTDFEFYWNPAENERFMKENGELPDYTIIKAPLASTNEANEKQATSQSGNDYKNNSTKKEIVNQKNKKIGNYQDNVGNYEHDDDLFFEE